MPERVKCPLVDYEEIDDIDCIENTDIAAGMIKDDNMPEKFKKYPDWKEICQKCKWHDY